MLWRHAQAAVLLAPLLLAPACAGAKPQAADGPSTNNNGANIGDGVGDLAVKVNGVAWDGNSDIDSGRYRILGN